MEKSFLASAVGVIALMALIPWVVKIALAGVSDGYAALASVSPGLAIMLYIALVGGAIIWAFWSFASAFAKR